MIANIGRWTKAVSPRTALKALLMFGTWTALSGSTCRLATSSDYPPCDTGIQPCDPGRASEPPQLPFRPGLPERGNCNPTKPNRSASLMDNLDYSSFAYTQFCPRESAWPPEASFNGILTDLSNGLTTGGWAIEGWSDFGRMQDKRLIVDANRPNLYAPGFHPSTPTLSGGLDDQSNAADRADLVVIAGHGQAAVTAAVGPGYPDGIPSRVIHLSRTSVNSVTHQSPPVCRVTGFDHYFEYSPGTNRIISLTPLSEMALGHLSGAQASHLVWATSCSLNDRLWRETLPFNRLGQEMGFERSPDLTLPSQLAAWFMDTETASNHEAWILNGSKIFAAKEGWSLNSGPVALAYAPTYGAATDLFDNASLFLQCRVGQKLSSTQVFGPTTPQHAWRKATEPCGVMSGTPGVPFHGVRQCGRPRFCDEGYKAPTGRNQQKLVSSPTVPGYTPLTVMRVPVTVPSLSDDDVALFVKAVADAMSPETGPFDASVIRGFVSNNRLTNRTSLTHLGGGVAFGFNSGRAQVRVLNRDVRDVIAVGGQPLDIGEQAAHDIAAEIAAQAGVQLLGLQASQTGAEQPRIHLILDGRGPWNGPEASRFAYVFSMFRTINGVPVLDLENTIMIHRSGQLYYTDLTFGKAKTHGPPGFEVPDNGGLIDVGYNFNAFTDNFMHKFDSRYGSGFSSSVVWSGFAYVATRHQELVPYFVVRFAAVASASGAVGGLETWGIPVEDPSTYVLLPSSQLGNRD